MHELTKKLYEGNFVLSVNQHTTDALIVSYMKERAQWLKEKFEGTVSEGDEIFNFIDQAFGLKPKTLEEKLSEQLNKDVRTYALKSDVAVGWNYALSPSELAEIARTHFREHGLDAE